jgi:hypothetical protein
MSTRSRWSSRAPPAASQVQITSDLSKDSRRGTPYWVSVSVTSSGGIPGGSVSVSDGSQNCTAALSGGKGKCKLTPSTPGVYTVAAHYLGDGNFSASQVEAGHTVVGKIYLPAVLKQ